jgi:hypothetical protein
MIMLDKFFNLKKWSWGTTPQRSILGMLFFLFWQFLIYGDLIINDPILGFDDNSLVGPLQRLVSVWDYRIGTTLDFQPVRDISFLLDIIIFKNLGISTFHASNVLIWLFNCLIFYFILRKLSLSRPSAYLIILLFSIHPVFVNSVGWVSARKHLLSMFFTLLEFLVLLNYRPAQWGRFIFVFCILYVGSLLSQPINIFFPLWAFLWLWFYQKIPLKKSFQLLIPALLLLILFFWYNAQLYFSEWTSVSHPSRLSRAYNFDTVIIILNAFGRYFINLVVPWHLSIYYQVFSWWNLCGLFFILTWIYLLFKRLPPRTVITWTGLAIFSLCLVTFNMTSYFVSDSYVLMAAIPFFYLNYLLIKDVKNKTIIRLIYVGLFCFFIAQAVTISKSWQSTTLLYKNSFQAQPSKMTAIFYLISSLSEGNDQPKDFQTIRETIEYYATSVNPQEMAKLKEHCDRYIQQVYENQKISPLEKINLLTEFKYNNSLKAYFLLELYLQTQMLEEARQQWEKYLVKKADGQSQIKRERLQAIARELKIKFP